MRGGEAWEETITFISAVWRNEGERESGRVSMRGVERTLTKSEVGQTSSKRAGANGGRVHTNSPVGWEGEASS